jgi:hypothetical protein
MADPADLETCIYLLKNLVPVLRSALLLARFGAREQLEDHANPLTKFAGKVFSQNDEDGITLEILRRIGLANGTFAEFGVGNGLENNTLVLAAAGWSGFWVGAEELAFDCNPGRVAEPQFTFIRQWITLKSIADLHTQGLAAIRRAACDVISLDLDGNDFYLGRNCWVREFCPRSLSWSTTPSFGRRLSSRLLTTRTIAGWKTTILGPA